MYVKNQMAKKKKFPTFIVATQTSTTHNEQFKRKSETDFNE